MTDTQTVAVLWVAISLSAMLLIGVIHQLIKIEKDQKRLAAIQRRLNSALELSDTQRREMEQELFAGDHS